MAVREQGAASGSGREQRALLDCDLVMKGGITSGFVYPRAVVRFARHYRIRSIGGTSVGALAGAMTAAAEYWRQTHPDADDDQRLDDIVEAMRTHEWNSEEVPADAMEAFVGEGNPNREHGFAALFSIPAEIGGDLVRKFQPDRSTRGIFRYAVAVLDARTAAGKLLAAVFRQLYGFRAGTALITVLIALSLYFEPHLGLYIALPLLGLVLALLIWARFDVDERVPGLENERTDKQKLGIGAGIGFFVVVGFLLLVQQGIGWGNVVRWPFDHLAWTLPIAAVVALIGTWPQIREWIIGKRSDDGQPEENKSETERLLRQVEVWFGPVALAVLVIVLWSWIREHADLAGVIGVGVLIGWVAGAAVGLLFYAIVSIPRNFNGICTGMGDDNALTPWLAAAIDRVAGVGDRNEPLTFRDLDEQKITFEAITSDLKRGVPLDIPNALENYRFRPSEFQRFFPERILHQLDVTESASSDLVDFPPPADIPLVVVARMSLSFPILFSAIPVYRKGEEDQGQKNWLSDGGIVSNFPLHKFDRALPPWPTFGIDLIGKEGDPPDVLLQRISLEPIKAPEDAPMAGAMTSMVPAMKDPEVKTTDLIGFAARIFDTARGWMDNSQKELPGYGERIVGVHLYDREGGMNLMMSEATLQGLADRGMYAAEALVQSWYPFDMVGERVAGNQWDQHRWLRYRILMHELEQLGREWEWVYHPAAETLVDVHDPTLEWLAENSAAGTVWRERLVHRWREKASADAAERLATLFDTFSDTAGIGVDMRAPVPEDANLDPRVFREAYAPGRYPKRLMIPPFD